MSKSEIDIEMLKHIAVKAIGEKLEIIAEIV